MTFRALIALAEGTDDLQTVTLIDVLRRAKVEVVVASIEGRRMLTCARGTRLTSDAMLVDLLAQPFDLIALPGGAVGSQHLAAHQPLQQLVKDHLSGVRDYSAPLWTLLMFDAFLANVTESARLPMHEKAVV